MLKVVIIALVVIIAAIVIYKVWLMDIDTPKLKPTKVAGEFIDESLSIIPQRDKNSIYQNGEIAAVASGFDCDINTNTCSFSEISKSGSLDLSKEFEFREYKLQFKQAHTMIGMDSSRPEDGRLIFKVICTVTGKR